MEIETLIMARPSKGKRHSKQQTSMTNLKFNKNDDNSQFPKIKKQLRNLNKNIISNNSINKSPSRNNIEDIKTSQQDLKNLNSKNRQNRNITDSVNEELYVNIIDFDEVTIQDPRIE